LKSLLVWVQADTLFSLICMFLLVETSLCLDLVCVYAHLMHSTLAYLIGNVWKQLQEKKND